MYFSYSFFVIVYVYVSFIRDIMTGGREGTFSFGGNNNIVRWCSVLLLQPRS
jgi:hypothetical protein